MFKIFEHAPGVYKRKYQVCKYTLNFKRHSYDEEKDLQDHCTGIPFELLSRNKRHLYVSNVAELDPLRISLTQQFTRNFSLK